MSDDLRRLIADGEKLGFTYLGQHIRGGHLQFQHESGKRVTAASTPSDRYAWINTRTDMERVSGMKLPRDNKAGKHSFKRVQRSDFQPSATEVKCAECIEMLVGKANTLRDEFKDLTLTPNRANAARARDLLDEFNDIRDELATLHRIITPIY